MAKDKVVSFPSTSKAPLAVSGKSNGKTKLLGKMQKKQRGNASASKSSNEKKLLPVVDAPSPLNETLTDPEQDEEDESNGDSEAGEEGQVVTKENEAQVEAREESNEDSSIALNFLSSLRQHAEELSLTLASDFKPSAYTYKDGISLLSLRNSLLLSYTHHLTLLSILKLSNLENVAEEREKIVRELVKTRTTLEKMRPLVKKLEYQVQKLVKKASEHERKAMNRKKQDENEEEEEEVDALSFRPNLQNFAEPHSRSGSLEGSDDEQTKDGIYRPPRLAAVPYPNTSSTSKKSKPTRAFLNTILSATDGADDPMYESTTGLTSLHKNSTAAFGDGERDKSYMERVQDYEESNFTRLAFSKKQVKERKRAEEFAALGLDSGPGSGKGRKRVGGFGAEFEDLLGGGGGRGKDGKRRREGGEAEWEALRKVKKVRKETEEFRSDGMEMAGKKGRNKFGSAVRKAGKRK